MKIILYLSICVLSILLVYAITVLVLEKRKLNILRDEAKGIRLQMRTIELENQLLFAQMDPHFIFNTLGVLQSHIRLDKKSNALEHLKKFSKLLRNGLTLSWVPLQKEMDTLTYYLDLQQMGHNNSFKYSISYDSISDIEIDTLMIPPMLIQPFIENAIIYGNYKYNKEYEISIQVLKDTNSSRLKILISDNGPGTIAAQKWDKKIKKSFSTAISRERLKILEEENGVYYGVKTIDKSTLEGNQHGTLVVLVIPVAKKRVIISK